MKYYFIYTLITSAFILSAQGRYHPNSPENRQRDLLEAFNHGMAKIAEVADLEEDLVEAIDDDPENDTDSDSESDSEDETSDEEDEAFVARIYIEDDNFIEDEGIIEVDRFAPPNPMDIAMGRPDYYRDFLHFHSQQ